MSLPIPGPRPEPVPPRRLPHIPPQPPARRAGPLMPPRITPRPVRRLDVDGPPEGHEWCPDCGGSGCSRSTSDYACNGCAGARIVTSSEDDS